MTREERLARFADKKTFQDWDPGDLQAAFGVKEVVSHPILAEWTSANHPIPAHKIEDVERLGLLMKIKRSAWNETELRNGFISPLLAMIGFEGEGYSTFSERNLTAQVDGITLTGTVDWMVATGSYRPEKPIFFLHEYKQVHVGSPDPMGQALAAMLAAQNENKDGLPVYGCYTVADIWRFILLDGKTYSVSQGYDASDKEEIQIVWSILQETKNRIAERAIAQL